MKIWPAPKGLHVEPAQPNDTSRLAKLHSQGFFHSWAMQDFDNYLSNKDTPILVACDAKRTIRGFVMIRIAADEAEILSIVVDKWWRKKKLGQALLNAALSELDMSPATKLFLEVDADNQPALALYERNQFSQVGTRPSYYPRPNGERAMALVLRRELG